MQDCKINVLGTKYSLFFRKRDEDEGLKEMDGYCDKTSKISIHTSAKEVTACGSSSDTGFSDFNPHFREGSDGSRFPLMRKM